MGKLKEQLREEARAEAEQEQLLYIEQLKEELSQYRAMVRAYAKQSFGDAKQHLPAQGRSESWSGGRLGTKTLNGIKASFAQKGGHG